MALLQRKLALLVQEYAELAEIAATRRTARYGVAAGGQNVGVFAVCTDQAQAALMFYPEHAAASGLR